MTRLAAFYYSDIPGDVGPVRSMRASDIGIVSPVDGAMVTSGAAARDDRPDRRRRHPLLQRGRRRASTATTAAARRTTCSRTWPRSPDAGRPGRAASRRLPAVGRRGRLPAGPAGDARSPRPSRRAHHELDVPGRHATSTRTPTPPTATSSRPTPCWCCASRSATPATSTRPATRCPRPSSTGKGQAMIFHDGRLVRGTWTKKSPRRAARRCRPRPAT